MKFRPLYKNFFIVLAIDILLITGSLYAAHLVRLDFIIDYKTARFTQNQDKLMAVYIVQLNGYAMIAEKIGSGKVSGLGLIYFEPVTDIIEMSPCELGRLVDSSGFSMGFDAHCLKIDLDAEGIVMPLLGQVRRMVDRGVVPKGRVGCEDCRRVGEVVKLIGRSDHVT